MTATNDLSDELLWIATVIHSHGIAVIHVGSGACRVPGCRCGPTVPVWSYTIGFAERGHPEVVTFGLHPTDAITLSNVIRGDELNGVEVRAGRRADVARAAGALRCRCQMSGHPAMRIRWVRGSGTIRSAVRYSGRRMSCNWSGVTTTTDFQAIRAVIRSSPRAQPCGAALASHAWCDQPDRRLRARLIDSAQQRRFT